MVELEMVFADLNAAMDNAKKMVKCVVSHVLENCQEDFVVFVRPVLASQMGPEALVFHTVKCLD